MSNRSALHKNDRVVSITANRRCGQPSDIPGLALLENRLKRKCGKVVTFIDDDLSIPVEKFRQVIFFANVLARVGLHISASTVRRIIKEPPKQPAEVEIPPDLIAPRVVTSKYPNHLWGGDITLVPTAQGLALGVEPEAMPQEHPYCFHVLNVMDHFSRRLMGEKVFLKCPNGSDVVTAFEEICHENGVSPKHLVLDHGVQFYCRETIDWCQKRNIKPRFGAVGQHGSIAVVERLHLSMKNECTRRILVPVNKADFEKELSYWREWYNSCRPHMTLKGRTPDEIYFNLRAATHCRVLNQDRRYTTQHLVQSRE